MSLREQPLASVPRSRGPLKPVTRLSIERIIGRSVAVLSVVFGVQAVPFALQQVNELKQPWGAVMTIVVLGGMLLTAVAGFSARLLAPVMSIVPIVYVIALVTWPLAVVDPSTTQSASPWLWYICNIALAAAAVAFSWQVAAVYLIVVPAMLAVVFMTPAGGGSGLLQAVLNATYIAILGAAILIPVELLRRASAGADAAQTGAIGRYAEVVRQHATEVERTNVDSIVHDGVLTSMLSAARAHSPRDRALAVAMAEASMLRLATAMQQPGAGSGAVPLATVHARLAGVARRIDPDASIDGAPGPGTLLLAADVAQTLTDAAVQALVNSNQHAGPGARRRVSVTEEHGVAVILVADDGAGFDPSVRTDRLGVRVSIVERVAAIGGHAEIESAPGEGTVVTLRWPYLAPETLGDERDE